MKRTPISLAREAIPDIFHPWVLDARVYDSSCSQAAQVLFLEKGAGYFLKSGPKCSLKNEALMTNYFHKKGLSAEVLAYESYEKDWLLTQAVPGEDCLHPAYLEDPIRLCDTLGQTLRILHETNCQDCPVDHLQEYILTARNNYESRHFDEALFPDNWGYASPEAAWRVVEENEKYLHRDTLLHGDYCLPNIMLQDWRFSGFIDLDSAGLGDRHIDLFWGIWSLGFNLKTDKYRNRFLDAYGRELVNDEIFPIIAAFEVFA